jgi:hypothetical protein
VYVDTTGMPVEAVVDRVMRLVGERLRA